MLLPEGKCGYEEGEKKCVRNQPVFLSDLKQKQKEQAMRLLFKSW